MRFPQRDLSSTVAALLISFFALLPSANAETKLADIPLANSPTVTILPNIMFLLDNSGSMDSDYMPDYVPNSYCRGSGTSLDNCSEGDPAWYTSAFNGLYYNPLVNYETPKTFDGNAKATKAGTSTTTPWDKVPRDGYNVQSTSTKNLVTNYPERWACNGSDYNDCKHQIDAANAWSYPNGTYTDRVTKNGAPFYYTASLEWCSSRESSGPRFGKSGTCQAKKTDAFKYPRFYNWSRVDITPATSSYAGPNGTTRTYAEEMNNFANWYAWYRTRMQMMKSAMSLSFSDVRGTPNDADASDKNYFHARVGFSTINDTGTTDGDGYLAIGNFDSTQKETWYKRLFAIDPGPMTPLRKALSKAGRIYAGKIGTDPIQYSCQRNFTILSTDGYYNDSSSDAIKEDGTSIGDQDGSASCTTVTRPSCDTLRKSNTLADIAYYYYHTPLRSGMTANVPPGGTNPDTDDVAEHQHMTTFTIGLGVDGTLTYQDGYKTSTSGDYYNIKQGTAGYQWPDPGTGDQQKIDDLWHAAVNGRGTYFSARNPESLVKGLTSALGAMKSVSGSGAAAATSNLQPTAGDNFIYIANYRTVSWDGELTAYTINLATGALSAAASWQAAALLDTKVGADADTRTIYTSMTGAPPTVSFTWANLGATQKAYFDNTKLSQYADWAATEQTAATGTTLVNYLRGQYRYEDQDRPVDFGAYNRLYRDRSKTLGDIVHSQPVFVGAPLYSWLDTGYSSFLTANASRAKSVYVAANDGMLHAFNADTGQERWAYVPGIAMKNMWRLADKDYATNHRYFLDGPIVVTDINAGSWKTILVGAMGKGGRGIYALDVTNPSAPAALWQFTAEDNPNLGYTFGTPMVTKLTDGTWVVVVASGHNNIPEGSDYTTADGQGHVFVLNAGTGALIKTINTGIGSVASPAGLAQLSVRVLDFKHDNTAVGAYGGDLYGNMWRFDLDAGTASKVAALGANQPIGVAPEVGRIDGKVVVFFGTGRYLAKEDLDNTDVQAIYAIRDDGSTTVTSAQLIQQTMTVSGSSRAVTAAAVDWNTDYGWYVNLLDSKERVHLAPQLLFGTLTVATVVPDATECQPGGYSWLYFLNARTGGSVANNTTVAHHFTSPIVGITIIRLPGGTPKVYAITGDGSNAGGGGADAGGGWGDDKTKDLPLVPGGAGGTGSGKRVMWRELLD